MFHTDLYHLSFGDSLDQYRQYFHYVSDAVEFADHGQIYLLVQIQNSFHGQDIAQDVFDAFKSTYFSDLDQDSFHSFEDSLKEMNSVLARAKIEEQDIVISAISAVMQGDTLFVSHVGKAEAYLYR